MRKSDVFPRRPAEDLIQKMIDEDRIVELYEIIDKVEASVTNRIYGFRLGADDKRLVEVSDTYIQNVIEHDVQDILREARYGVRDFGPWVEEANAIQSDDFHYDVRLNVSGDFGSASKKKEYIQWLTRVLNLATSTRLYQLHSIHTGELVSLTRDDYEGNPREDVWTRAP